MKYLYLCINKLIHNLRDVDWFTKNDLFISIKYGVQERRTNVKWNNNKPEWNESFIFEEEDNEQKIICEIYDHNMWSPSQRLGIDTFDINVEELRIIKGKYLEITLGDILFKKEVALNLLTLKNSRQKKDLEKIKEDNSKLYNENTIIRSAKRETDNKNENLEKDIKKLDTQNLQFNLEYTKLLAQYKNANSSNLVLEDENTNLLDEKDKILKKNGSILKENIALNEENINLFDKIESIKAIVNK